MQCLKQSTAVTIPIGPFVDATDGDTEETGLTISQADVVLSKNGGSLAQKNDTNAATHDAKGYYSCTLDATDTGTLGRLVLVVHESGALQVRHEFMVLPANVYDALVSGSDTLQADVTQLGGVAQSATDLKHFADTGYDPATGKVEVVKTVDTTTTNTDMRGTDSAYTGTPPTAGAIADAVCDEALSGHATAGTVGKALADIDANVITVDSVADAIQAKTDNLPASPAATGDIPSAASIRGEIDSNSTQLALIVEDTNEIGAAGAGLAAVPWNSSWDAEVQSEVVDALNVDTYAQPGQGAPPATTTIRGMLGYLYKAWRNRSTQTADEYALYADDETTKDQAATCTDDGTTFNRDEVGTGA